MKFQVNDMVFVHSSGELKQIIESEKIYGEEIYYTEDNMSFHVSQLVSFDNFLQETKIYDEKKLIDSTKEYYNNYINNIAKNSSKYFGLP